MNPSVLLFILLGYFAILFVISFFTARKGDGNAAFFVGKRQSPWYLVAFGMIGASVSGVSVVSVPGMVPHLQFTYLQTVIGFFFGYIVIAYILLPLFYKLQLISIYTYLRERFGLSTQKTGAFIFIVAKLIGSAAKLYVAVLLLQEFIFRNWHIPFYVTVCLVVLGIWLYTRRGGIKTIVWTDCVQTLFLLVALVLMVVETTNLLGWSVPKVFSELSKSDMGHIFIFDDWHSKQNFFKQFLSGIFIVIVMTGLDQDMMQKNLTCKTLREAQKDMCTYGLTFVPANLLFLALGILLAQLANLQGVTLPETGDNLLPMFAASGKLGTTVVILFTIGIVAASFSSADSAMTALTTSWCIDIKERPDDEKLRRHTHLLVAVLFIVFILAFKVINSTRVIDAIYILCSYTYGPLLGLFAFGLLTKRKTNDRMVPYVAIASPLVCFLIDTLTTNLTGYKFGYELLMLNGLLTFMGLWMLKPKK